MRKQRPLTKVAFTRLLAWLHEGAGGHAEPYLEMRRRLVSYFDRRNRLQPDDLADETLSRIGRMLEEEGAIAITPPARYCYVVARRVLLEDLERRADVDGRERCSRSFAGSSVSHES